MSEIQYNNNDPWSIGEAGFDAECLGKTESIFCQGNGYMGVRAASEERYAARRCGTFVAGTFARFSSREPPEIPNCPDMTGMDFWLDGIPLNLLTGRTEKYRKGLNLKNGELIRSFTWEAGTVKAGFRFRRFVSMERKHLFVQRAEITNLGQALELEIVSGINGQVTNGGSQLFDEGEKAITEKSYLQMYALTTQPNIPFAFTCLHLFYLQGRQIFPAADVRMSRRVLENRYQLTVEPGQTIVIEKMCSIHTGRDRDARRRGDTPEQLKARAVDELGCAADYSYEQLLAESANAWDNIWSAADAEIFSDDATDQPTLNFARYHMHIMAPDDERMNIGAKGLSGEGYKGHTFWDTEIFLLPYFTLCYPETAEKLIKYRYLGLAGARKKARANGYLGAQYPWEAAYPADGETTPLLGPPDIVTGRQSAIWSGLIEQHITGDVVYGLKQYVDITGDTRFLNAYGYEIILDTALFWAGRFEWNDKLRRYELRDIIGPDEYREHVDNNAYTNHIAHWNLSLAVSVYEKLEQNRPALLGRLKRKLGLPDGVAEWKSILDRTYLPKPDAQGIIPQDDGYMQAKRISLDSYKNSKQAASIFRHYNHEQIRKMQISKQADVLLLLLLLEQRFPKSIVKKNWRFYEPRTLHDSSLSLSTHAILAADFGESDTAYAFFQKEKDIDMGENMRSSDEGLHAAAMGGIWQTVVFGFGGLRIVDGRLRIEPSLPLSWNQIRYSFYWQGARLMVEAGHDAAIVTDRTEGKVVSFDAFGIPHTLNGSASIDYEIPVNHQIKINETRMEKA